MDYAAAITAIEAQLQAIADAYGDDREVSLAIALIDNRLEDLEEALDAVTEGA